MGVEVAHRPDAAQRVAAAGAGSGDSPVAGDRPERPRLRNGRSSRRSLAGQRCGSASRRSPARRAHHEGQLAVPGPSRSVAWASSWLCKREHECLSVTGRLRKTQVMERTLAQRARDKYRIRPCPAAANGGATIVKRRRSVHIGGADVAHDGTDGLSRLSLPFKPPGPAPKTGARTLPRRGSAR